MGQRRLRLVVFFAGVAIVTFVAYRLIPVNTTTVGFAYLLLVLVIASTWGFLEAALASVFATLFFNFFFFPPVGKFTIADPQNWVALFSFLATSLIASRLSTMARRRALEAMERQRDLGHLYAFSRSILLIDRTAPFPQQLLDKLAEIFELRAAVLFERNASAFYRTGSPDIGIKHLDEQLREVAFHGMSPSDPKRQAIIVAVRLGPEPIASLAPAGRNDARLSSPGDRESGCHRSMAHEFKTPLTLIKAATTSLLSSPDEPKESRQEQLTIADEEAEHLRKFIDDAVEMARLDTTQSTFIPKSPMCRRPFASVSLRWRARSTKPPLGHRG